MTDRRPARDQVLPENLAQPLAQFKNAQLFEYCRDLYHAGWTLRAIGEALEPPRQRSTVRSWILKVDPEPALQVEAPTLRTTPEYVAKKPKNPGISPIDRYKIFELAPIARRFRAGMPPRHRAAAANDQLTAMVKALHQSGVPVQELADAAGVTYRAMARRLKDS